MAIAIVVLAFAAAKFIYQDFARLAFPLNDFTSPWLLSKAFAAGVNPYSFADASRTWDVERARSGPMPDFAAVFNYYGMVYPPTSFPIIAPFTLLHWKAAVFAYLFISTALLAFVVFLMSRRLRYQGSHARSLCFVAFSLALAPVHSGIHELNLSTFATAFILAAVVWMEDRPHAAGIALALGLCLRPQAAVLFFGYLFLRKKWKTAFTGLGMYVSVLASSVLWMGVHGVHWVGAYREDAKRWSELPTAHFDAAGVGAFQLLNLQVLAFQFTGDAISAKVIAGTVFAVLAGISIYLICSRLREEHESLGLAIVSVLSLLPVYQRFYAGAILILVLYWAVKNWPDRKAIATFLFTLPLLLPLAAMLQRSAFARSLDAGTSRAYSLWTLVLLPHAIWIELAIIFLLLTAAWNLPRATRRSNWR